jgi:2-polyprenyl-6-methoxyphenol hydroxylase-like FAD-dependent oxidoreductase
MLLARKGYRVLLVDKAQFPSDTVSTHVIWQAGLARARRWGLLDGITGLGAPPIRTVRLDLGAFELAGCPPALDGIDYAVAPRRTLLDKLLVDAAVQAGAELREGFYVSDVEVEDGRVTGIRGRTSGGNTVGEKARIVVGADGTGSFVAHAVQAAKYNVRPSTSCAYYSYWEGGPAVTAFETYIRPNWGGAMLPTNNGLTCIVGGWNDAAGVPEGRPAEGYRTMMESFPRTTEFLRHGKQAEPLKGMREQAGFFRKPWGDGWALAGDAGYHKHPLSAQGITDAFRDADLLSEALDAGFSGRREMRDSLADYQQQRDSTVMPMYQSTCDRARLEPPQPEVLALFSALRHNQSEVDRFFGLDAGTVSMAEFFAPGNVARIIASSPGAASGCA